MITKPCVLVTGAGGYIGGYAVMALRAAGFDVVAVDNFSTTPIKHNVVYGDIRDVDWMRTLLREYKVDAVMHFAALTSVAEGETLTNEYFSSNVVGTWRLMEAMAFEKVHRLVFSSSAAVYGMPKELPITEEQECAPSSFYGYTKASCERHMKERIENYPDWSIAVLRYFNVVGGEMPLDGVGLFPNILRTLRGEQSHLMLYGGGEPRRDFIHVEDLVMGHIQALSVVLGDTGLHTWNLGTGTAHSVLDVADMFEQVSGKPIPTIDAALRQGDILDSWACNLIAVTDLRWKPKHGLEDMVRDTWEVYCGHS